MRISDWSSDVSSSNLQRFPSSRRAINYQVGTNLDYGIYLERGTRDHGPRTAKVLRFRGRNGAFVFAKRVKGIRATRWLSRSEEHTSELQSLMRISYAVFCLKKKIKNYKKNIKG